MCLIFKFRQHKSTFSVELSSPSFYSYFFRSRYFHWNMGLYMMLFMVIFLIPFYIGYFVLSNMSRGKLALRLRANKKSSRPATHADYSSKSLGNRTNRSHGFLWRWRWLHKRYMSQRRNSIRTHA